MSALNNHRDWLMPFFSQYKTLENMTLMVVLFKHLLCEGLWFKKKVQNEAIEAENKK